jgi:hypothetical protein
MSAAVSARVESAIPLPRIVIPVFGAYGPGDWLQVLTMVAAE